jgi:Transglycosylase associated protein
MHNLVKRWDQHHVHYLVDHRRSYCRIYHRQIMKGSGYGVLGDIIVGIVGAVVGGFIMRALGHAGGGGLIYHLRCSGRRGHPDIPAAAYQRPSGLKHSKS